MATVYEVLCSDGRTIGRGAFAHQDGQSVPLVWRHGHDNMDNIVGTGTLTAVPNGMAIRAKFNRTTSGKKAKILVEDRSIRHLSVWANQIQEHNKRVTRGEIREVSLVLAGANPGATIEDVVMHNVEFLEDEDGFVTGFATVIHSDEPIRVYGKDEDFEWDDEAEDEFDEEVDESEEEEDTSETTEEPVAHADGETVADILATFNEDQMAMMTILLAERTGEEPTVSQSGSSSEGSSVEEVFNTLSEKQKNVVYILLSNSVEDDATIQQNDSGENMHNIFEEKANGNTVVLSHDEQKAIIGDAMKSGGSLKQAVLAHAATYGVENLEILFPDAVNVKSGPPQFIQHDPTWVNHFMAGTSHSPMSRIKSQWADITEEEARARGYITATEKFDDVFPVFGRSTTPKTVYKRTKIDRDDVLDITSFDVIAWMKKVQTIRMREELSRAGLIGDGRANNHVDKINPENVRPIYTDSDVFVHRILIPANNDILDIMDVINTSRVHYKGSGAPTLYTNNDLVAEMTTVRDTLGRRMHESEAALQAAMRVSAIVEVIPMSNITRVDETVTKKLIGILVNPGDYTFGADKGGQMTMFDDFDLNFNQMIYLLETRVSGALTIPKSAIIFEKVVA